jgi:urease accessory protein
VIERLRVEGGGAAHQAAWGLGGAAVNATIICTPADATDLEQARAALEPAADMAAPVMVAATLVDGALVVRARGADSAAVRARLERLWTALRPRAMGRPPCPPRIWLT